MKADQRSQAALHREVHRPVGHDSSTWAEGHQVKRIKVKPGAAVAAVARTTAPSTGSWSRHARVTRDNDVFELFANQKHLHPDRRIHRLENPGHRDAGADRGAVRHYLGEDDIVRFDDVYGRSQ